MPRKKTGSGELEQQANTNSDLQEADTTLETSNEQATDLNQDLIMEQATPQTNLSPESATSLQEQGATTLQQQASYGDNTNSGLTGEASLEPISEQEATTNPASNQSTTQAQEEVAQSSAQQEQLPAEATAGQTPEQAASQPSSDTTTNQQTNSNPTDNKPAKVKKERVSIPKQEFTMILDGGRSQVKVLVLLDDAVVSTLVLESTICQVEAPPFGELGAFSTSREKIEVDGKPKDLVESWIVGTSAKLQGKDYISMSDGEDNKIKYFPILALGAIASLPNLFELSTGSNEKNRSLSIKLVTQSLANPAVLKEAIKNCKWLRVDGIKYSLTFSKEALNYPEGYGAALHGQGDNRATRPVLFTFDVGFGTACVSEYNNLGKLPKRVSHKPNGGGGVATLIREFAQSIANSDSAKVIKPSQLREILSTAAITEEGEVYAVAPDGRNVGNALDIVIRTWVKDSPLTFALESLGIQARKHPVVLCGGGFAIPPVQKIVKEFLTLFCHFPE